MEELRYSEFLEWLEFLQMEEERHSKTDIYLAQIAAEVRRSFVSNPRTIKVKDFLLAIGSEDSEQKIAKSKASWMKALHLKKEKK